MKQQTQEKRTLPQIGVLALMLEAYEPIFPGIIAQQTAYVKEVLSSLGNAAVVFV
jgi:L-arabinose isomerase